MCRDSRGDRLSFDAASIKRNTSGESGWRYGEQPGGRWSMVNAAIILLIRSAYPDREVVGAPEWVQSARYDVNATAGRNPTRDEITSMLQALLADRFKAVVHDEAQQRAVFALVIARRDKRLGAGLQQLKTDCDAVSEARRAGRAPEGPVPRNGAPLCGWSSNGETLRVGGLPMSRIAGILGKPDGRVIVDKTGLTGNYEFSLSYTNEPDATADRPSLFTALEEQLGLKLVADRAPLPVIVIDHIEPPTED